MAEELQSDKTNDESPTESQDPENRGLGSKITDESNTKEKKAAVVRAAGDTPKIETPTVGLA
jgi:hypothetical protein